MKKVEVSNIENMFQPELKRQFQIQLQNRFEMLGDIQSLTEEWQAASEVLVTTTEEVFGTEQAGGGKRMV